MTLNTLSTDLDAWHVQGFRCFAVVQQKLALAPGWHARDSLILVGRVTHRKQTTDEKEHVCGAAKAYMERNSEAD